MKGSVNVSKRSIILFDTAGLILASFRISCFRTSNRRSIVSPFEKGQFPWKVIRTRDLHSFNNLRQYS